jgi:uncharacterized DUF497 family protein
MGRDSLERVIVAVWTWDGENIHLISARQATPRERRRYAEGSDG